MNTTPGAVDAPIDTVIFDVGWVLVRLNFQPLLGYLARQDQQLDIQEIIAAIDLAAHERGEITGDLLLDRLHGLATGVAREQVKRGWLAMFEPVLPMFALAKELAKRYRVYLLSNVGDLHWAHLNAEYDLRGLVHDVMPSFEAGVMKPDPEIYRLAEQRFQLTPSRTVFIDDLEANILAARQRGWHGIQHFSPDETKHSLRELGVTY